MHWKYKNWQFLRIYDNNWWVSGLVLGWNSSGYCTLIHWRIFNITVYSYIEGYLLFTACSYWRIFIKAYINKLKLTDELHSSCKITRHHYHYEKTHLWEFSSNKVSIHHPLTPTCHVIRVLHIIINHTSHTWTDKFTFWRFYILLIFKKYLGKLGLKLAIAGTLILSL